MDKELRDSLMEWYLRFGEGVVDTLSMRVDGTFEQIRPAWNTKYISGQGLASYYYKITPEGIEVLKNDG